MAAQPGVRPACDCLALAPSRLVADLGMWLTWPVAWRAPEDRPRDSCAYRSNEPREFSVGRAADPWGTAQTRVRRVAGHRVPLHATAELSAHPELAHLPAEPGTCDRYGGLGEAGRISDQLLTLVRGSSGLSGAPPRCGMASLAGLSSHHGSCTRLGHLGPQMILIGAPFMMVACRSVRGAPLKAATIGL